eukprot:Skav218448  [mRNA]  locus=scaffold538:106538:106879:- [translate_table: standard]
MWLCPFLSRLTGSRTPHPTNESNYRVVLERPEGEPFGVTMGGHPSVQGLLVVDLLESTAVRRWNDRNHQHPIEIGLAVLEVNGIATGCHVPGYAWGRVQLLLSQEIFVRSRTC